jgi:hypothetical protein
MRTRRSEHPAVTPRTLTALCRRSKEPVPGASPQECAATDRLVQALEENDRFRRDGRLSGIFHPGRISFRELSPQDSLHIVIDDGHVSAHVDEVCPIRCHPGAVARFTWSQVLAHNFAGVRADLKRRVKGLHGQQRCNLGCEVVWVDDEGSIDHLAADVAGDASSGSSGLGSRSEQEA